MTQLSKEELLKIAKISHLRLYDDEIDPLIRQIQGLLSYAMRVQEIASDVEYPSDKNVNVLREDMIDRTDSKPLLQLAPDREDNYYVVPQIIDGK